MYTSPWAGFALTTLIAQVIVNRNAHDFDDTTVRISSFWLKCVGTLQYIWCLMTICSGQYQKSNGHTDICIFNDWFSLHICLVPINATVKCFQTWINVRDYRRGNTKWTIQKKLATEGTQDEEKQSKNTTQYVLDTTIRRKQK